MPTLDAAIYNEIRKAGTPLWVSGMTVAKWQDVRSPIDGEVYMRTAATGGGTTDPADDWTNYVARSYRRITALPTVGDVGLEALPSTAKFASNAVVVVPTATSAGVRVSQLSVSGRGQIAYLGFAKGSANGGTLELLIDGRTVFNDLVLTAGANFAIILAGSHGSNGSYPASVAIPDSGGGIEFRRSVELYFTPATTSIGTAGRLAYIIRGVS